MHFVLLELWCNILSVFFADAGERDKEGEGKIIFTTAGNPMAGHTTAGHTPAGTTGGQTDGKTKAPVKPNNVNLG